MKFLDLFSVIGGFRLGLERSGHTPVGYVEIDKFARQSYQAMYNTDGEWTAEDINKIGFGVNDYQFSKEIQVIGNIHENADLLEEQ